MQERRVVNGQGSARILFIRQHLGPIGEGTSARGWEQLRRLADEGHTITVVTGRRVPLIDVPRGVLVRTLETPYAQSMGFFRRKVAFAAFAARTVGVVVRHRYDVVFASSTPLTVFIPAMLAKVLRRSTRLVLEVRDLWPALPIAIGALTSSVERWLALQLETLSYRFADAVIALSPGMAEHVEASCGKDVAVVSNGASRRDLLPDVGEVERLRRELGLGAEARVVLYAGSIGVINDPEYLRSLIVATIELDPSLVFVVAGSGPGYEDLQAEFDGVDSVRFVGRVPRTAIGEYFGLASVSLVTFVDHPLMETNSANKFFDSLAAGCPVALNYGGWHEKLLDESGAGLRLGRDPEVAASELSRILAAPTELQAMGRSATELARQFDWDVLYPRWRQALLGPV